jgi:hypothetical protein
MPRGISKPAKQPPSPPAKLPRYANPRRIWSSGAGHDWTRGADRRTTGAGALQPWTGRRDWKGFGNLREEEDPGGRADWLGLGPRRAKAERAGADLILFCGGRGEREAEDGRVRGDGFNGLTGRGPSLLGFASRCVTLPDGPWATGPARGLSGIFAIPWWKLLYFFPSNNPQYHILIYSLRS